MYFFTTPDGWMRKKSCFLHIHTHHPAACRRHRHHHRRGSLSSLTNNVNPRGTPKTTTRDCFQRNNQTNYDCFRVRHCTTYCRMPGSAHVPAACIPGAEIFVVCSTCTLKNRQRRRRRQRGGGCFIFSDK